MQWGVPPVHGIITPDVRKGSTVTVIFRKGVECRMPMLARALLLGFVLIPVAGAVDLRYWIEACTRPETRCKADDPQLAEWALKAWEKASSGKLRLEKTGQMERAHIRLFWAASNQGLYGEARPILVGGVRGAEVYVLPDLSAMGPDIATATRMDPLLRDAIVYLTCLHESGHALGLAHTRAFADIMYSFQFGGDIPEYFGRYRRLLKSRADIATQAGMSAEDRTRLAEALDRDR
jgi:hypothetical protein